MWSRAGLPGRYGRPAAQGFGWRVTAKLDGKDPMSRFPSRLLVPCGLLAVALLAPAAQAQTAPQSPAASPPAASPPAASPPAASQGVPVSAAPVKRQDVPILLRNIGAVQPFQTALIRARVDGTLDQVFFQDGQEVKRGDLLAQIDPRPYQAVLDQAMAKRSSDEAQLANARQDLARGRQLVTNQAIAQSVLDTRATLVAQLEAQIKGDEASIAAAQVNVDYTRITAPFDGRLGFRLIDPGNVVRAADAAGVGIVTISQIRPIAVTFSLPQHELPRIQAAMARGKLPVMAYTGDDKVQLDRGELLTVDNSIDPGTGTIKLKAIFPNAASKLWPGQFINAVLEITVDKGALTVPSVAVQRGPNGLFVYLVKPDSTVAFTPVTIGQDDGKVAVVEKGLEEGAMVVTNGQSRLQNGARVAVAPAKASS